MDFSIKQLVWRTTRDVVPYHFIEYDGEMNKYFRNISFQRAVPQRIPTANLATGKMSATNANVCFIGNFGSSATVGSIKFKDGFIFIG